MNRLVVRNVERKSPRAQSPKTLGEIKAEKRIPEEKTGNILTITFKTATIFYLDFFSILKMMNYTFSFQRKI